MVVAGSYCCGNNGSMTRIANGNGNFGKRRVQCGHSLRPSSAQEGSRRVGERESPVDANFRCSSQKFLMQCLLFYGDEQSLCSSTEEWKSQIE